MVKFKVLFSFLIPINLLNKIRTEAKENGLTVSELIRKILGDYF